ncbi:MAG TPA: hypothetical protein DCQ31_09125 [Bacteroidales bacterium]|nr:hypothetical protein [Bacteroidales bacterium]
MDQIFSIFLSAALTGTISAIISVAYTRKNLKTSKYIETITSERIRWIENIRNDFSTLTTSILILRNNEEKLHVTKFNLNWEHDVRNLTMRDEFADLSLDEHETNYKENRKIVEIESSIKKCLSPIEIVMKAIQLKLKIDSKENYRILKAIDEFNLMLDTIIEEFSKVDFDKSTSKININRFIELAREILNNEWNVVKIEVAKK